MLVVPIVLMAPLVALMLPGGRRLGPIEPATGLALLLLLMFLFGSSTAARHRPVHDPPARTEPPGWPGVRRVDGLQLHGLPGGAAIAGALVTVSLAATIWVGSWRSCWRRSWRRC